MGGFFGGLVGAGQTGEQIAQGKEINRQRQMSDEEFQQKRQQFQVFLQQAQQQMAGEKQRQTQADPKARQKMLMDAGVPERQALLMALGVSSDVAVSAEQIRPKIEESIKDLPPETQNQLRSLFDINVMMNSPQKGVQAVTVAAQQWRQQQETEKNLDKRLEAMKEKPPAPTDVRQYTSDWLESHGLSNTAANRLKAHAAFTKETKTDPGVIRMESIGETRGLPVTLPSGETVPMNWNTINRQPVGSITSPAYNPDVQSGITAARGLSPKNTGQQVQSYGTFIRHAGNLYDAISSLKNSNYPDWNKPMNWLRTHSGDSRVRVFMAKMEPVQKEFESFLLNNRALHEEDREAGKKILDENATPQQMLDVLPAIVQTGSERLSEGDAAYVRATGKHIPNLITPSALLVLKRMGVSPPQVGEVGAVPLNAPAAGTVKNGYRFKGGDPADKNSWVKQ